MKNLRDKNLDEISLIAKELGWPAFKAKDIFRFVHQLGKESIDELTTLSAAERAELKGSFYLAKIKPQEQQSSQGVKKAAFQLSDGKVVEAVLMDYEGERKTVCVSSQIGCPIGCLFCATGQMGFGRNLTVGEILSQIYYFAQTGKVNNIVFMGMGESFLNYNNVLKAARILNHPLGQNIAARKIVFSTIGLTRGINKLATEPEQFRLAWSLVAPNDQLRQKLIAAKKLEPLAEVLKALRGYQTKTNRRITLEYVVLGGVNDGKEEIKGLIQIAKLLDCHINLIPYNSFPGAKFKPGNISGLHSYLVNTGLNATIRHSFGQSINAACGQLAATR
jgi:23S rRNA (adenine2503-C2)-methyltransferase